MQIVQELTLRFPVSDISNVYDFRFETVEPALDDALQSADAGICDYGFVDAEFLNMIAYVNEPGQGLEIIRKVLDELELHPQIWISENGVLKSEIKV